MQRLLVLLVIMGAFIAACGDDTSSSSTVATSEPSLTTPAPATTVPPTTTVAPATTVGTTTTLAPTTTTATPTTTVAAPVTHFVSVQEFSFGPMNLTVAAGDIVVWTFDGSIVHTTTGPSWNSGNVSPGGSYQQTFGAEGTFNYICTIHPGSMQATVTVTP